MRRAPALLSTLAVAALVALSLAGCASGGGSSAAGCTPVYGAGAASSTVTTDGASATFPTPLVSRSGQVSVITAGHGVAAQPGDQVDYTFDIYNGSSGDKIGAATTAVRSGAETTKKSMSISRSLVCARPGEKYALVTTVKDSFGAGAGASAGISDTQTLVMVVSVKDRFIGKANGVNVLPQDGMPSVVTAVDGQPGLVIQELAKPSTLRIETVKSGSGAVVKNGQTVHVKYSGWTWPVSSSDKPEIWPGSAGSDGTPATAGNASWTDDKAGDLTVSQKNLPVGLYKALVGAKVGSQVLAVIPPKDGFGAGSTSFGITANDTVIMVIDVLGIR